MIATLGVIDTFSAEETLHDASRLVGGETLVRRVARRVSDAECLEDVAVVVTPTMIDELRKLVPTDATIVASHLADPIARLIDAADQLGCEAVLRVDLHSPFIDPDLIDGLVIAANRFGDCDYLGYRCDAYSFQALSQIGLFGEWCLVDALRHAIKDDLRPGRTSNDVALVTECLMSQPNLFQLRFIRVPTALERDDLRLRLTRQEDWDAAEDIIEALEPEELNWYRISNLLSGTPRLRAQMRARNVAETAGH
jgi:spore coat polysaccharide biosynthesis protein SpsF (cytidylyltransferase family)